MDEILSAEEEIYLRILSDEGPKEMGLTEEEAEEIYRYYEEGGKRNVTFLC